MNDRDIWIGIDLGTQSVRVLAVTGDGEVLSSGQAPLRSERSNERHEQNPREWWDALGEASRQAMRVLDNQNHVRALSVCGTSGTVLLIDDDAQPLSNALMYDDGRASVQAEAANQLGAALWERLGYNNIQTVWGLPKWMWLASQHPEGRTGRFAQQADFITGRLAGRRTAADISNALKSGCDTIDGTWRADLMATLGLAPSRLPGLVQPGTVVDEVCAEAAAHTGLPKGTPIVAGMTDGCASQLASGAVETGSWNSVLGTTLVLKGKSPTLIRDPSGIVYSHRAPDGDWLPGGASSAGAGAFSRALGAAANFDDLSNQAQLRLLLPAPVYPLASGRGERFPFIAPGLSLDIPKPIANDPVETYRSLAFGITAVERLCFDYLAASGFPVDGEIALTGGGAKNPTLNRLRATMLDRTLKIPAVAEPALGMALLASTMKRSFVEASRRMVRVGHIVEPDAALRAKLSDYYLTFVDHLQTRGWLPRGIADHARGRAA